MRWRFGSSIAALAIVACGGSAPDQTSPEPAPSPPPPSTESGCCINSEEDTPPPPPSPYPACSTTATGPCSLFDRVENTGAAIQSPPRLAALDATSLYWAEFTRLSRIPKNGSTSVAESVATADFFGAVVVDASAVYWTDSASLQHLEKAGGAPQKLADTPWPAAIAIDATNAYVVVGQPPGSPTAASHVIRVPLSGGAAASTAFDTDSPCTSLALDDTSIYCQTGARISRFPKAGGAQTVLLEAPAGGFSPLDRMVLADATLYVKEYNASQLTRLSVDGTRGAPLDLGTSSFDPDVVVKDGAAYVAIVAATQREIRRVPLDGSATSSLPTDGFTLARLTVDASGLYWVDWRQTCLHGTRSLPFGKGSGGGYVCHEFLFEVRAMRAPLAF